MPLAAVIILFLIVCCGGPIAAFFAFGGFALLDQTPKPVAEIVSCEVNDKNPYVLSTDFTVKVTNTSDTERFVSVEIELQNAAGKKIGEGFAFLDVPANSVAEKTTVLWQDTTGGKTCVIAKVLAP